MGTVNWAEVSWNHFGSTEPHYDLNFDSILRELGDKYSVKAEVYNDWDADGNCVEGAVYKIYKGRERIKEFGIIFTRPFGSDCDEAENQHEIEQQDGPGEVYWSSGDNSWGDIGDWDEARDFVKGIVVEVLKEAWAEKRRKKWERKYG